MGYKAKKYEESKSENAKSNKKGKKMEAYDKKSRNKKSWK